MTKEQLKAKKQTLLADIQATTDMQLRMRLQAEVTIVNAEIKKLNIEENARNRRDAAVRKALGKAEEQANTARAIERVTPEAFKALSKEERDKLDCATEKPAALLKPHERPFLTQGEFIIKTAKALQKAIRRIPEDKRLPHTKAFEQPLHEFVEEQKLHLKEYNLAQHEKHAKLAAEHAAQPEAWKQTWSEEDPQLEASKRPWRESFRDGQGRINHTLPKDTKP